jgi:hypothetical protein
VLSVTFTENVELPCVLGVPVIVPVVERLRPGGSEPLSTDHEYGDVPPIASNDAE